MTAKNKSEIITQITVLLSQLIEANDVKPSDDKTLSNALPEMLTIKECTETFKGLKEHTLRKLVKQDKVKYIRTGEGRNGKILVNKSSLSEYLSN